MNQSPTVTPNRLTAKDLPPVMPFVDGRPVASGSADHFVTHDPSTGEKLLEIGCGAQADVDAAVAAARRSFEKGSWYRAAPHEKKAVLSRWADLIAEHAARLDALDAIEMGKPVAQAGFSAASAAALMRFNAEALDKVLGDVLSSDSLSTVIQPRGPRGVVAAIVPWNFPTYNCIIKLGPALAAGNSVILKPSEYSSQSALLLARLALDAGLPPGVLNIVPGRGDIVGRALAEHMDVDMVTFTGSTAVGKRIMQYAGASNMKVVGTECGGKSPQIIFDDGVDIDAVATQIARSILFNQGQVCSFGSRILVQDRIKDDLLDRIRPLLAGIRPGDPQSADTSYGPLVSKAQFDKVAGYIEAATVVPDRLAYGGRKLLAESGGYYIEPTILHNLAPDDPVVREEIFGPVVAVLSFADEPEAIRLANDSDYGLAAYIWSANMARGFRLAHAMRTAITVVNTEAVASFGPGHAFSGEPARMSGLGVEGGLAGLEAYQRRQTIWFNHG